MRDEQVELAALLAVGHPCIVVSTREEQLAKEIVHAATAGREGMLWTWSAVQGLTAGPLEKPDRIEKTEHPAAAFYHAARQEDVRTVVALDVSPHLHQDPRNVRALRELLAALAARDGCLIVIEHEPDLPPVIADSVAQLDIGLPEEAELHEILKRTLSRHHYRVEEIVIDVVQRDLEAIVRNLRGLTRSQAERVVRETIASDRRFDADDITVVLDAKRRLMTAGGVLELVDAPTDLSQIGGMRRLKRWLEQRERAFEPEAAAFGITPPRGLLMLGIQGTGKSLCAKAIATAWRRPLVRMDAGALYDRYIGESERRLRDALGRAEGMAPVILWIDEIEKAFASASSSSNDGGLSRRMFGALLTWMQEHRAPVFLVATANDIDALPPELLRKGRFDEIFFVDLPDEDVRREILAIHLRKRNRDPAGFDLDALAACSDGFSAAELEQAVVSALHTAFSEGAEPTTAMVAAAIESSPPLSVTAAEKIRALQAWAEGRCVPAD